MQKQKEFLSEIIGEHNIAGSVFVEIIELFK